MFFFSFVLFLFIRADILTKITLALFGIFSGFFDTIGEIFIYFNKTFYIDKNGLKAFFAFRLVWAW